MNDAAYNLQQGMSLVTSVENPLLRYNYALLDPVQMSDALSSGDLAGMDIKPIVPHGFEDDATKFPLLVDLEILDEDMRARWWSALEAMRRAGQPPLFGALLSGPSGYRERIAMHKHLATQLVQRNRQSNKRFLLRYYDPRVFAHMQWILRSHQLRLLFGPIREWSYIHQGEWQHMTAPSRDAAHPLDVLVITDEQWTRLHAVAEINAVTERLNEASHGTPCGEFALCAQQIFHLLSRASKIHELADEEDRKAFAYHGMTVSRVFDSHPIMIDIFARLKDDHEAVYRYETAALAAEQWQEMALNHPSYR